MDATSLRGVDPSRGPRPRSACCDYERASPQVVRTREKATPAVAKGERSLRSPVARPSGPTRPLLRVASEEAPCHVSTRSALTSSGSRNRSAASGPEKWLHHALVGSCPARRDG